MKEIFTILIITSSTTFGQSMGELVAAKLEDTYENQKEELKLKLKDPETYNKYVNKFFHGDTKIGNFFNEAGVKFVTLSLDDTSKSSLGVSWDFAKSFDIHEFTSKRGNNATLDWAFSTKGNVAFNSAINPQDFLAINISLNKTLRVRGFDQSRKKQIQKKAWALFKAGQAGDKNAEAKLEKLMRETLGNDLYSEVGLNVGFESDQKFRNSQFTFGARTALDFKAYDPKSIGAKFNVFDYPSAFLRWATRTDKDFQPNGASIPSLLFTADYVNPVDAEIAVRGGDENGYFRVGSEIASKSLAASVFGEHIYLELNARYFKELDASSTIKSLGRDEQFMYSIGLVTNRGWSISYSEGDLPFSEENDRFFGVGFKSKF